MGMYTAIIYKDPDSAFGAVIPDCPGCYPAADEFSDIYGASIEALRGWAEAMIEEGHELPKARPFNEVIADEEIAKDLADGATTMLVPLLGEFAGNKAYSISMDSGLMQVIDRRAKDSGLTRSSFLAKAAKEMIAGH
jgi:predicted RNase H-like HicB family nuclease